MQISHGGGQKLLKTDPAYDVLRRWLEEGCRPDPSSTPRCVRIQVYPESGRVLKKPAHTQQLSVLAHFSDGSVRDITSLATYGVSDDQVAWVAPEGIVIGRNRGTVAVSVRYLDAVVCRNLTFVEDVPGFVWNNPKAHNYIDDLVHEQLQLLNYLPAETCGDGDVFATGLSRRDRVAADPGGNTGVPGRYAPRQARQADRRPSEATGIREVLGPEAG